MLQNNSTKKFLILFTVLVDILGIGIIIPVLPFYVESFGATPLQLTLLFSVFSLFSLLSAPWLGALSDKIGRRPVLIISILSTAIGWLVFASAKSIWVLFLGRIIDGAAAGNFPIAQSYLADLSSNEKERTHNLGLIGAMFGIGLTVGPLIGGLLSHYGSHVPFWFVGWLALGNVLLALKFLPETHPTENRRTAPIQLNPLIPLYQAFTDQTLRLNYLTWFLFGLAVALQQSVFSLFGQTIFSLKAEQMGWILTGMGIVLSINQALLLRRFWLKRFTEPRLEIYLLIMMIGGFILLSIISWKTFLAGILCFTLAHSVLRVVMTSQLAAKAGTRRGEVLGISSSVISLSMIVGPILGGLFFNLKPQLAFMAAAFIGTLTLLVVLFNRRRLPTANLPDDVLPAEGL
jgi:MFS family permease